MLTVALSTTRCATERGRESGHGVANNMLAAVCPSPVKLSNFVCVAFTCAISLIEHMHLAFLISAAIGCRPTCSYLMVKKKLEQFLFQGVRAIHE